MTIFDQNLFSPTRVRLISQLRLKMAPKMIPERPPIISLVSILQLSGIHFQRCAHSAHMRSALGLMASQRDEVTTSLSDLRRRLIILIDHLTALILELQQM